MDIFDWIEIIKTMRDEGYTQQEIADRIGMSRSKVADYSSLINEIVAKVLVLTKQHQKGRATEKVANATFNFTEGWFRNSGLYQIDEIYQELLITVFVSSLFYRTAPIHYARTREVKVKYDSYYIMFCVIITDVKIY